MEPGALHEQRMRRFEEAGLYLVTSQPLSRGRTTLSIIESALRGGVRLIQLREKDMPIFDYVLLARKARELTAAAGALLMINDRLDAALAVHADGVHLGQEDCPIEVARRVAPDLIIGASTHSEAEAEVAQRAGASYVNIGPIFPTGTKRWDQPFLGLAGLRRIRPVVRIPFTVMGGIKEQHIAELAAAGARTIAVVTAVTMADDPELAARELRRRILLGRNAAG